MRELIAFTKKEAWHILRDLTEGNTVTRFPSPLTPSGQPRGITP